MMPPTFDSDHSRNQFTTRILLHHLLPEEDIQILSKIPYELNDNQKTALIFLREVGAVDNTTYRQLTGLTAREATAEIKQLESYDLIKMHGQGRRAYYTPTDKLMKLLSRGSAIEDKCSNIPTSESNIPSPNSNLPCQGQNLPCTMEDLRQNLPSVILEKIDGLGKKVSIEDMQGLVVEICYIHPFSSEELSILLNRHEKYIRQTIISKLLSAKKLFYTIPEMVRHPQQKYTAIPKKRSETGGING